MRVLINKITLDTKTYPPTEVSLEIFTQVGNITFEQLSSLRHRGAFSTVSLTFGEVCKLTQHKIWQSSIVPQSLVTWYQVCLGIIYLGSMI